MSIDSAKLFINKMNSDEVFAQKVIECKNAETRMAFAKEEGFDFSAAEMEEMKAELSDDELDVVAGGSWCSSDGCATGFKKGVF